MREMLYGLSQPENTPEYDEWQDAQSEKLALLKKADDIIQDMPCAGLLNGAELESAIMHIAKQFNTLVQIRMEYDSLDDMFPADSEPDQDTAYDDNVWEGDR